MHGLLEIAKHIIQTYGYLGIFGLTTFEQFILPIPSEVYVAMGSASGLSLHWMFLLVTFATLIGATIGYTLGKKLGHPVFKWLFGQKWLDRTEHIIKKWGFWGVMIMGYTPFPFKLITWSAGIFELPYPQFMLGVCLGRLPRYFIIGYLANLALHTHFYATTDMSAILLGTVQGLTEFLPISSSGHLALLEHFVKMPASVTPKNLETFDIFLHAGSLLAILLYFWKDWVGMLKEMFHSALHGGWKNTLFAKLAIGTLPAIAAGLFLKDALDGVWSRGFFAIGLFFVVGGFFYLYAEWKGKHSEGEHVTLKKSLIIGFAQALAILPSLSRSGMTIGTGLLTGIRRDVAAKFSFLLGGVAILAATTYALYDLRHGFVAWPDPRFSLIGFIASFIISIATIHYLLKFLKKHTLRPFAVYVLILGTLILAFF
jgi:undecaprenyl-diphosphatase